MRAAPQEGIEDRDTDPFAEKMIYEIGADDGHRTTSETALEIHLEHIESAPDIRLQIQVESL